MGYDMYVRTENGRVRDDDRYYLRRNIWGGHHFAEALVSLGMGFKATGTQPSWPEPDDFGVKYDDEQDAYVGDRAAEFKAAENAVLDWHGNDPDRPGIPVHKVCSSNDGWHVTKQECQQAVAAYELAMANGATHPQVFQDDVLPFLRLAAEHEGFETH